MRGYATHLNKLSGPDERLGDAVAERISSGAQLMAEKIRNLGGLDSADAVVVFPEFPVEPDPSQQVPAIGDATRNEKMAQLAKALGYETVGGYAEEAKGNMNHQGEFDKRLLELSQGDPHLFQEFALSEDNSPSTIVRMRGLGQASQGYGFVNLSGPGREGTGSHHLKPEERRAILSHSARADIFAVRAKMTPIDTANLLEQVMQERIVQPQSSNNGESRDQTPLAAQQVLNALPRH
jgi:hypothetical protein